MKDPEENNDEEYPDFFPDCDFGVMEDLKR